MPSSLNIFVLLLILVVLRPDCQAVAQGKDKDISYREYLGYSLLGTIAAIPPAILIGRTYYSDEACRDRGDECDPYVVGPRMILSAVAVGSSVGTSLRAKHKWHALFLSLAAQSVPIVLTFKYDVLAFPLSFLFPAYPFVSAYIGYEMDRMLKKERGNLKNAIFLPQVNVGKERFTISVSLIF